MSKELPGNQSAVSAEQLEGPIDCHIEEHVRDGEAWHFYLRSNDPRFKRVEQIFGELYPHGECIGISTTAANPLNGLDWTTAEETAIETAARISADPHFCQKIEDRYAKYLEAKKALMEVLPPATV
ncbi:TPA: hypothetical protein DF272_03225 [Candidatus Falkowbacteria bacterium]|nr:hypothetical protein [Candidatus Falkowbacteria bacterium]